MITVDSWLVVWNIFHFSVSWECRHPNWRSFIFFEGVGSTTNQIEWIDKLFNGWIENCVRCPENCVVPATIPTSWGIAGSSAVLDGTWMRMAWQWNNDSHEAGRMVLPHRHLGNLYGICLFLLPQSKGDKSRIIKHHKTGWFSMLFPISDSNDPYKTPPR